MKKILTFVLIFICIVSSFFTIVIYQINSSAKMDTVEGISIFIDIDNKVNMSKDEVLDYLSNIAKKENIPITRKSYSYLDSLGLNGSELTIYTTAIDGDAFYQNIGLSTGSYLNDNGSKEQYLSQLPSNDSNQIGTIRRFDNKNKILIKPFSAQTNLPLSTQYIFGTKSKETIESVKSQLSQIFDNYKVMGSNLENPDNLDINVTSNLITMFFCLYLLLLLTFIYYIMVKYKEISIKKLFGYSNNKIIYKNVLLEVFKLFGIAECINVIVLITIIGFYNKFSDFNNFIIFWILIQTGLFIFTLLIFGLISQIIKRIKVSKAIKNKKSDKVLFVFNFITKFIFTCIVFSVILSSLSNIIKVKEQNEDYKKWCEVKDYVYTCYNPTIPDSDITGKIDQDTSINESLDNLKLKKFYDQTQNIGVLCSPGDYYKFGYDENNEQNSYPDFHPDKKAVKINYNYLKLNPIYDLNENAVDVNDNLNETVLLVPEKYQEYEQTIIEMYTQDRTWHYHVDEDNYREKTGEDIGYKGARNAINKYGAMPIKIIFVKDNQDYFVYRPLLINDSMNNRITDPISIIVNNNNCGWDEYGSMISRGEYLLKVDNIDNPQNSLNNALESTNTITNLEFFSIYHSVDNYINNIYKKLVMQLFIIAVSICVLISILLITVINYLDRMKYINSVKKLNGYSLYKRYYKLFLQSIISWTSIFIFILILNNIFKISTLGQGLLFYIIFLSTDIFISTVIIKFKELKSVKKVLNGG